MNLNGEWILMRKDEANHLRSHAVPNLSSVETNHSCHNILVLITSEKSSKLMSHCRLHEKEDAAKIIQDVMHSSEFEKIQMICNAAANALVTYF